MAKQRPQTGGLQEKKVYVEPTKEELKEDAAAERARRKQKAWERREAKGGNIFKRMWNGIRGVMGELKKVNWPTLGKTLKQTGVVLGVVLAFSLVVFGIDRGLAELFKLLVPEGEN